MHPLHDPSHQFPRGLPSGPGPLSVSLCRCGQVHVTHGATTLRLTQAEAAGLAAGLREATLAMRQASAANGN